MKRLSFVLALGACSYFSDTLLVAQQATAPQLVVTGAAPDASGQTLTITGGNFGNRPLVTLDLVPLTVQVAVDTQIVAAAPVNMMPAGEYLLTVSRGPSALETGSFVLKLGADVPGRADTAGGARSAPTPAVAPEPADAGNPAFSAAASETAAKIGDRVITIAEVDRQWRRTDPAGYLALGRELYDQRRRIVDAMVADDLLAREAAARGLTTEALLAEEIPKRRIALPDSAVTSLYLGLGDNTRGASLEQMRPALRAWLERNTEPELAKMSYIEELVKISTRAETFLAAPRVQVERAAQDVVLGAATSVVEIVAFAEFQSAEYARLAQAFKGVRDTFGDRVRVVFKNLPVIGPESVDAAEAAQCANAQDKFWAYHDALLVQPGATISARIAQSATAAGLNLDAFKDCVESRRFRDVIEQALDEARRYGLERSPSFLVNGRLAPNPPPFLPAFEFFKRLIEEELGWQAKSR